MKADEECRIGNAGTHPYHHFDLKVRGDNAILKLIASLYIFLIFIFALSPPIVLAEESKTEVLENQLQQQPENYAEQDLRQPLHLDTS